MVLMSISYVRLWQRLAKGDFEESVPAHKIQDGTTYALRSLGMLHQHGNLLIGQEALEASGLDAFSPILISLEDDRVGTLPAHKPSARKHLRHELLLRRQLDADVAITDLRSTTLKLALLELLENMLGLMEGSELDEAVQGLASLAVHDDVDGVVRATDWLRDDASGATERCEDLVL